jgi:hypothetical protein
MLGAESAVESHMDEAEAIFRVTQDATGSF